MGFDFEFKNNLTYNDGKQLLDFLHIISDEFIPPLSERLSDNIIDFKNKKSGSVEQYYNSLLNGYFLLAYDGDKLVGFIAYKPFYYISSLNKAYTYISCIGVLPEYRNRGLAKLLYLKFISCLDRAWICVRTWSTNEVHTNLLKSLSFDLEKVITDDRGKGIDTYYFTKLV